jgi:hypothetical protein
MKVFENNTNYSIKLDVIRIFLSINFSQIYRDCEDIPNGFLICFFDMLSPIKKLQHRLLRKLESSDKVILDFRLIRVNEYCHLSFDLIKVDNWEYDNIDEIKENGNGLCIIFRYKDKLTYQWFSESELRNEFFSRVLQCRES